MRHFCVGLLLPTILNAVAFSTASSNPPAGVVIPQVYGAVARMLPRPFPLDNSVYLALVTFCVSQVLLLEYSLTAEEKGVWGWYTLCRPALCVMLH